MTHPAPDQSVPSAHEQTQAPTQGARNGFLSDRSWPLLKLGGGRHSSPIGRKVVGLAANVVGFDANEALHPDDKYERVAPIRRSKPGFVEGGSSVLAGKIENGEDYGFFDGAWDLATGHAPSHLPSGNQLLGPGAANLVGGAAASQVIDWGIVDTGKLVIDNSMGGN